ncbi:iron-siderophore ABC transporter substrate-binding protein [Streptomyces albus subsp. chlorinus]|uniref:ABC transporter substrate-binding protein n=1 Tax=Streptomyces albus TaxID=1888 RepID=UPI00156E5AED|nr:iron-siderophore ABC transporter substrate-binding protein [Streptomyces albus]NSC22395.1 iron-siderophore ABC transporter substrate-binding protein [Streptomyces albus subsp. chlorinus]
MKVTRTWVGAALVLTSALALSGCGSDSGSGSGSGSGSDKGGKGGTHTVKTANGPVKVPDHPQRVVVLDTAELDSAITLGVRPVGATTAQPGKPFLGYLPKDRLKDVENVGVISQPSMEKILSLKPDLILTNKERDGSRYDELSKIAPTVMTETTGYPWKKNFQVHAEALGKKAEAKKVLADYAAHTRKVTQALGGRKKAAGTETSVIRFQEGADTRVYGERAYIATLLKDVGLSRPPAARNAKDYGGLAMDVSPEQVDKGDADAVFYTSYGDPGKSGEAKAVKSPLWKNMRAVKNNRAFHVEDELWIQGIGYTAADKILDELEKDLTK